MTTSDSKIPTILVPGEEFRPPGTEVDQVDEAFASIESKPGTEAAITNSISAATESIVTTTFREITPLMVQDLVDHFMGFESKSMDVHLRNGRAFKFVFTDNPKVPLKIFVTANNNPPEEFYLSEKGEVYKQTDANKISVTIRSQVDSVLKSSNPISDTEEFKNMKDSGIAIEAIDIFRTKAIAPNSGIHVNANEYNNSLVTIDEDLSGYIVAGFDGLNTPILIKKIKPDTANYLGHDLFDIIAEFSTSSTVAA